MAELRGLPVPYENYQPHPLISLLTACFSVIFWLLAWVKTMVAFATITIPRWIYAILSYTLTLQLNFVSLVVIIIILLASGSVFIRYKYLNTYADLREQPLGKPNVKELHPDVQGEDNPTNFHNYLDEFLSAVRIFGFLEKPVFHELARHLQTRRLIAGDSLALDQDQSFYCVVDGLVQVFAPSGRSNEDGEGDAWAEEEMNGYHTPMAGMSPRRDDPLSPLPRSFAPSPHTFVQSPGSLRSAPSTRGSTPGPDYFPSSMRPPKQPPIRREPTINAYNAKRGLVARATVDTTLAVIPAEAFTRLTNKFPKASAHIVQVILTRFSRVTFNAAHRYLGLTTEVLRTEKAINDLARHPLPASFYSGGGMQNLRNRFAPDMNLDAEEDDDDTTAAASTIGAATDDSDGDYFGYEPDIIIDGPVSDLQTPGATTVSFRARSSSRGHTSKSTRTESPSKSAVSQSQGPSQSSPNSRPLSTSASRTQVAAGDLLTTTGNASNQNSPHATYSSIYTPGRTRSSSNALPTPLRKAVRLPTSSPGPTFHFAPSDDFNLRDEVMACIAKSIGLIQPPISSADSADGDNGSIASRTGGGGSVFSGGSASAFGPSPGVLNSSFTRLTLLEMADDSSSMTGGSSIHNVGNESPYATGLDNEVEILCFAAGSTLVRAGERNAGLFYVIDGFLDVSIPVDGPEENTNTTGRTPKEHDSSKNKGPSLSASPASGGIGLARSGSMVSTVKLSEGSASTIGKPTMAAIAGNHPNKPSSGQKISKHLFTVKPGGIAGYLASLCATPSYVDIKAKVDTYVGFLPATALERLLERRPIVLFTLAKRLISLVSPLVLHIDSSLDWMQVNAGQVLWRTGDASDSFYIVINGRLRALGDKEGGGVEIVGEYGQGDTIGELDVITGSPRRTTLHAIRDTELAKMPRTLFNAISMRHPRATLQILRMIASRVRNDVFPSPSHGLTKSAVSEIGARNNNLNLKTVAILPAAHNVPVSAFAKKLQSALEDIGAPTVSLNQASVMRHVGRHAFTRMGKLKVAGWLADQEQRYRMVLYVADSPVNAPWTTTCIRQADYIMVLGMGDDPSIGEYERLLLTTKTTARKELVLLHPDRTVVTRSTREWLKNRTWIHAHMHVELPGLVLPTPPPVTPDPAAVKAFKDIKQKVQTELQKYRGASSTPRSRRPNHLSDFARLARRLCGKSVGIVLGGGGARGIAHLGFLRALEERSIPVDHVGGTSIGAFVGGLYAAEGNLIQCSAKVKAFSSRMSNIWRILSDVTWPVVAYTTGHEFNRGIFKAYGALHIEDMWLPFFTNTTNILTSRMEIHDTGYAWRYVRASMSLVGLLPPLCDYGNMLVDGGYLDNLPVSTMMSMGARTVFAVDVGSLDDNSPRNFGDSVSGWWLLLNRFNPFSAVRNIPPITEIQSRLAYVSSVSTLEEAKNTPGCFYVQLPVQDFGTLQFGKFEELYKIGYQAGLEVLDKLKEEGKLQVITGSEEGFESASKNKKKKGRSLRRNSV
ncbi:phosphatidylcholine and lysophosphatidylcholine phospholipase [Tulasnella sp. 418]|nr:phosphatidylcholine and lysophosphatidylcholine phospholipase [Tulasnella sp. 418]